MTVDYKIDENDFLTYQLYMASNSERIRKRRQRNKVMVPGLYAAMAIVFLFMDKTSLAIIFFIIAVLWYFFYPFYERKHHYNHFKGLIRENYKERLDRSGTLEINNNFILVKDDGSESKLLTKEIEGIDEIITTIFVRLKTGQAFILPKDKIKDLDLLINRLKELANHLNIVYKTDLNWVWK